MTIPRLAIFLLLSTLPIWAQSAAPNAVPEKQRLLWQRLERDVRQVADGVDGVMAVAITDLTSGEQILINPDEVMPQASSIKITVLLELYRQAQSGKLRLADEYVVRGEDLVQDSDIMGGLTPGVTRLTLRDLATMMVAVSDNAATNVLIDRVGMENVNASLRSLGLEHTRLRRKMMDLKAAQEGRENVATAREMTSLLRQVYQGKVLNKEMTADFFKVLSTHKDSPIPRLLPEGLMVADKPGALEGVRTDSGIVFVPGRPFVVSVMGTYLRDERAAETAISRIAKLAYDHFDRLARSSEYGRVISTSNSSVKP
ncbi:MAG: serine hydrolase [Acidobacteriales bacterium]|nr:serine hydrolase [Terriglobales bacterium]